MPTAQIMPTAYAGGTNIPAPHPSMVMPYSMPTSQQPFFQSLPQPQMMYSSPAPNPIYHQIPMTHHPMHGMNPQFHHQMGPPQQYPQYMPHHQTPQHIQQQLATPAVESNQEQQRGTTLVPEDLLISFD